MIAGLVLAAGAGRRFGHESKLLQDVDGRPIIRCVVDALHGSGMGSVTVVVPPEHAGIAYALHGTAAHLVTNVNAEAGMGTSLAAGIAAVPSFAAAVLVTLGDIPRLSARAIARVSDRFRDGDASIVVPEYRGVRGHPVIFARSVFIELEALPGDQGARVVIERDATRVAVVALDEDAPLDVDTAADLARVRGNAHHTSTPTR